MVNNYRRATIKDKFCGEILSKRNPEMLFDYSRCSHGRDSLALSSRRGWQD
jgi:hypothetical protein